MRGVRSRGMCQKTDLERKAEREQNGARVQGSAPRFRAREPLNRFPQPAMLRGEKIGATYFASAIPPVPFDKPNGAARHCGRFGAPLRTKLRLLT